MDPDARVGPLFVETAVIISYAMNTISVVDTSFFH